MHIFNSRRFLSLFPVFLLFIITGCGPVYTFNNESFSTADSANDAHRHFLINIENEIKSSTDTTKGSVAIVTPSQKTCEALGVNTKGSPPKEVINYLGKFLEEDYSNFSKYLIKSNDFKSVESFVVDYPNQYANSIHEKYDYTIYLDMKSQTQIGWFVMKSKNPVPVQVNFDNMAAAGAPKIQSWIENIRKIINY